MKEKLKKAKHFLEKKEKISGRELLFGMTAMLFAGMVIGILISPKGERYFGSLNGNSSGNLSC